MGDFLNGITEVLKGNQSVNASVNVNIDTLSVVKACVVVLVMLVLYLAVKKLV
ncbi:MAG: hypothetical protein NC324_02340 [Bacteroides sp.]|nr:hypothetical protein [Bacteroides sp.]